MITKNAYSIGSQITPFGIAFYIAPYINAVTRTGTVEEKTILFEAMLDFKAYQKVLSTKRGHFAGDTETIVEQACRICTNVKNRQTKERDNYLNIVEDMIQNQNLLQNKILCIQLEQQQKTALSGLIANQLMSKYQKPVLVLTRTFHEQDEDWWEGSGRGLNIPGLEDCRGFYESTGLVEYAQGHNLAFGIGIKNSNFKSFIDYTNNALKDYDFKPIYKVDFIYDARTMPADLYDFYNLMEYSMLWGQEISQPLIAIENIPVTTDNITLMKGTTLKIEVNNISLIKFRSTEEEFETLCPNTNLGCVKINVIGVCEKNSYNDKPQIIIKDFEIIERQNYYF